METRVLRGSGIFADGFDVQAKIVNNIIVAFPAQLAVFCGNLNDVNPPIFQNNDVVAPSGYPYAGLCTNQTGLNGNISADPIFASEGAGRARAISIYSPDLQPLMPALMTALLKSASTACDRRLTDLRRGATKGSDHVVIRQAL